MSLFQTVTAVGDAVDGGASISTPQQVQQRNEATGRQLAAEFGAIDRLQHNSPYADRGAYLMSQKQQPWQLDSGQEYSERPIASKLAQSSVVVTVLVVAAVAVVGYFVLRK